MGRKASRFPREPVVSGIRALTHDGRGIADTEGKTVFVDGALPGELVRVQLTSSKKDYAKGAVTEVLERSPLRDSPSCAHRRAGCGGCDWMHLAPAGQLDAKTEIVRESLRRVGRLDPEVVDDLVHYFWSRRELDRRWLLMHATAPAADLTDITQDPGNPIVVPSEKGRLSW